MQGKLYTLLILSLFINSSLLAQGSPDCSGAFTLCSDASITFSPSGIGSVNDFASGANSQGCLTGGEHHTAWYYFEFNPSTPPGSQLEFTISPIPSADYDFAVFGPGVDCGSLGSPIRCSYAFSSGSTGVGNGATDFSEGAGGNGFVAPLTVNPGEGYYLVVDNFSGNGAAFNLDFSGSAAPFLDCNATPCALSLNYTPSYSVCGGNPPLLLSGSITGNSGTETIIWSEPSGGTVYMNNPTSPNPTVSFPPGASANYTYTITVTDGACVETANVNVSVNPLPMVLITGDDAVCQGGTATLSATAGYNSYQWSPSGSGQTITISTPGLYTVTATGAGGCQNTASFNVVLSPSPTPSISGPTELCNGGSATLDAGTGYDSYMWQDGTTTQLLPITAPGTYDVTVTLNGCSGTTSYTVNPGQDIPVSISGDLNICTGGTTILNATPGYASYMWQDGTPEPTIVATNAGTYSVTATDISGCTGTTSVNVIQSPPITPNVSGDFFICTGVNATLIADAGYDSYQWSTAETSSVINPPSPGNYSLTVTDAQGCQGETSVSVQAIPDPMPSINGELAICPGESTQLFTDPGFNTYQWSTGSTSSFTNVIISGPVSVTVTNSEGCIGSISTDVIEAPIPTPDVVGVNTLCPGGSSVLSATPGFDTYLWSDGTTTSDITITTPGTYTLTVTNQAGCSGTVSHTVTPALPPTPFIDGDLSICDGASTLLSVTGGAFDSYLWTDGSIAPTLEVFSPGLISVTVTDAAGCEGTTSVGIVSSSAPSPSITGLPQICGDEGSTTLQATPGYTSYQWSDGTTDANITISIPGIYDVTVTNTEGCAGTASITVDQLPAPTPNILGLLEICEGQSTTLNLDETYIEYLWYDGQTEATISIGSEGPVSVIVTDANGCEGETSVYIEESPSPSPVIMGDNVLCPEDVNTLTMNTIYSSYLWQDSSTNDSLDIDTGGTYSVTVTNSDGCEGEASILVEESIISPPTINGETTFCTGDITILSVDDTYDSYFWNDSTSTTELSASQAGIYSITVTDIYGCSANNDIEVIENELPDASINGLLSFCTDGMTTLSASTDTGTYLWSNDSTNQNIIVNTPGNYSLTITAANGCVDSNMVTVTQVEELLPTISGEPAFCEGASTTLDAGLGYSSYLWEGGETNQKINVDAPGTYSITVADANGCEGSTSIDVIENALPNVSINGDNGFCVGDSSLLNATPGFVAYEWQNGATDSDIMATTPGTYSVTVTDDNGCSASDNISVAEYPLPEPSISGETSFCPGTSTDLGTGTGYTSYLWSTNATTAGITTDMAGTYSLTVTDDNACIGSTSIEISEFVVTPPVISGPEQFCPGTSASLTATGYQNYLWSTTAIGESIEIDTPGDYSLTATDNNACESSSTYPVSLFEVNAPAINGELAFCQGGNTVIEAENGFVTYEWQNGTMEQNLDVNVGGIYSVMVSDSNNCFTSSEVVIIENSLPEVSIGGSTSFCTEGFTTLNAGNTYASYLWSDNSTTFSIQASQVGIYALTVTDDNGCAGSTSVEVIEADELSPVISGPSSFCPGESITLDAGEGFATYDWSTNSNNQSISINTAGDYQLTVTDEAGCSGTAIVNINAFTLPTPVIDGEEGFCEGSSMELSANGGTFSTYNWSTGETSNTITIDNEGIYELSVTDANGCTANTQINVLSYTLPDFEISGILDYCAGESTELIATPGFANYEWSNEAASNINSITVNTPGNYALTITNNEGCTQQQAVTVIENALPNPVIEGNTSFCFGGQTLLSANSQYNSYFWSNGSTNPSITVDEAGNYTLTVTNNNGCEQSTSLNVIDDIIITPTISGTLDFCPGTSTNLDAGEGYISYDWSSDNNNQSIEITNPGAYSVTVIDTDGCIGEATTYVNQWPMPQPLIEGETEFCQGDASILSVSGGSFGSYEWSNGVNEQQITINEAGILSVLVTDANNCQNTATVELVERPLPVFTINGETAFCENASTNLTSSEVFTSYQWSNGNDEASITTSESGIYTLTATNEFGCMDTQSIEVVAIPLPQADAGTDAIINCYAPTTFIGGTGSSEGNEYSYHWTGPGINTSNEQEQFPNIDIAGDYTLTVINETYGCVSETAVVSIEEQMETPQIVLEVLDILDCTTSTVFIDGTGSESGTNVVYQWYDDELNPINMVNSAMLEVDEAALYFLLVTDTITGCNAMDSIMVQENEAYPIAEAGNGMELNCDITSISLDANGSQQGDSIEYLWTSIEGNILNGADSQAPLVNAPGWYFLNVTDLQNGCNNMDSVYITQDIAVPLAITNEDQTIDCLNLTATLNGEGSSEGSIYTQVWAFNHPAEIIASGLHTTVNEPGTYYLIVTNTDNQCSATATLLVDEISTAPSAMSAQTDDPTCLGDEDGSIQIQEITGGTAPYLFSVNGSPFSNQTFYNQLGAGDYEIIVQDAMGCEHGINLNLAEANDLMVNAGPDIEAQLGDEVNLNAIINIPEEELVSILWASLDSLSCIQCLQTSVAPSNTGLYEISITDINGCTATDEVYVFVDKRKDIYMPTAFSPNGDDKNDIFFIQSGSDAVKIRSFLVFDRWGEIAFQVYNAPTNNPDYGWNGTYRGELYNSAVFTWFAEVEFLDGEAVLFKGDVALMR